ncbi:MAG: hypothetical protein QXI19_03095 [Candidatus Caldarchaeum sp.]
MENLKGLNSTSSVAGDLVERFGLEHFYLKSDGSLSDGFEIVTHPAPLESHKGDRVVPWKALCKFLIESGFTGWQTGTCGLHVHVNRSQFFNRKFLYQYKLAAAILRLRDFLRVVSGRRSWTYCKLDDIEWDGRLSTVKVASNAYSDDRYHAVSFTPYHTVEFRFPRGTLKYECLVGTLELVALLVEIVNDYGLAYITQKLTVQDVINKAKKNQYRYFFALLQARGVEVCA